MNHLKVVHVPGKSNRADALTKSVPGVQMRNTMERSGYIPIPDRAEQGSDEAIGLIVQRPWPDPTT